MIMSSKQKLNALITCESCGKYTNFWCEIPIKDGKVIKFQFNPFCSDKKVMRKLCYLIKVNIED